MQKPLLDYERGSPRRAVTPAHRFYYASPRHVRFIIFFILTVYVIGGIHRFVQNERDFALKKLPTDFSALTRVAPERLPFPDHPIRLVDGTHIGDEYIFVKDLGKGKEGTATVYLEEYSRQLVVVKAFTNLIRNNLPEHLAPKFANFTTKWPAEIEAGLLLESWENKTQSNYVPVWDYFILRSENTKNWTWVMVTPFIEDGTLKNLAKRTKVHDRTPQKLDKIFRPTFNAVLEGLKPLHAAGYCHNDIKPDNIFVANTTHWLLGDLGNVREWSHPWHFTVSNKRQNQWSDCALNDVCRALKTYLTFLRDASGSSDVFDLAFYAEDQAWSQLFWQFMRHPIPVEQALELSRSLTSDHEPERKHEEGGFTGESSCLRRKIDRELTCVTQRWELMDWWPFGTC